MNVVKIAVWAFFLLYLTTSVCAQDFRIIFVNKTSKTIDSLVVNGLFIGQLKPDSLSKIITDESLAFDSSGDKIWGTCLLNKQPAKSWPDVVFCGTSLYIPVKKQGDFVYNITSRYMDSREYIFFTSEE